MTADFTTHFRVFVNPFTGGVLRIGFLPMMATKRKSRTPTEEVLRANVLALLAEHYDGKPGRFAKKHGKQVKLSRIQGIAATGACSLQTLHRLANAFELKAYQLLIPDLDVKEAQVAVKASHARALEQIAGRKADEVDGDRAKGAIPS